MAGPATLTFSASSLLLAVFMSVSAKRETLMSASMAHANSRASVIISPVEIGFGGGTRVHEVPVDFYEGGRGGMGV